ncbi:hypothetical protein PUN28_007697 [Cardiocondyla obscurior]|uniref:Uncharacterized protein n=1 Tax=Cardiocondyla obscurior TaxID=286306 RepID=A0AAW2FUA1_9HYME
MNFLGCNPILKNLTIKKLINCTCKICAVQLHDKYKFRKKISAFLNFQHQFRVNVLCCQEDNQNATQFREHYDATTRAERRPTNARARRWISSKTRRENNSERKMGAKIATRCD